ncbi:uncharacterized protein TOT_020000084 [Theileria orientalis strain Shintoku]|uniref:Peptidase C1A papain C-terminal domain-containing protein n=1 Tax=Theileria orientalis strain Shintoku TaxID=869250 RepID=J4C7X8_THEOR|nr:uncharacterized protein TOT_020000084 [Theileria orientalis strain Shintoku]BAM39813.1 uncharacterized protein TOT_020000084 [Theileria orientalis strain Shintoku]|eukprot:XP_009690114.1 uncharacterized protein TOT_020000084 [Theileria orientalis strain Shintoku]
MDEYTLGSSYYHHPPNGRRRKVIVISTIVASVLIFLSVFLTLFYIYYLKGYIAQKLRDKAYAEFAAHLDIKESGFLNNRFIYNKLKYYAINKDIEIIESKTKSCSVDGCKSTYKYVHDWKLRVISKMLEGKDSINLNKEFEAIMKHNEMVDKYDISYKNKDDFKKRYTIFRTNWEKIEKHNKDPNRLYDMEYNWFAETSDDEEKLSTVKSKKSKEILSSSAGGAEDLSNQDIHIDWRKRGAVSEVIAQGRCGSCWAIAATDMFTSFNAIKKDKLVAFSYQQTLDCSLSAFDCSGGSHRLALEYIKDSKMCTETSYKYKEKKGKCDTKGCETESGVKDIKHLTRDTALEFLKTNGPFVTSMNTNMDFKLYGKGIFNSDCGKSYGHSVLVVGHGYDKEKKVNYWIVKNSWGKDWGEDGYFRMLDLPKKLEHHTEDHCDFLLSAFGMV